MKSAVPCLAVLTAIAPLPGQQWADLDPIPPAVSRLVYDARAQRLLAICDHPPQTWSFDGAGWRRHSPDGIEPLAFGRPTSVLFAGYDAARGQGVALVVERL